MIFSHPFYDLNKFEVKIKELKDVFKTKSRSVISQVHQDDWCELEDGLVNELEQHFSYWDKKFEELSSYAKEALQQLSIEQKVLGQECDEFYDKVERLVPRDNKTVIDLKNVEKMLVNQHELKDARHIRRKTNNMTSTKLESNLLLRNQHLTAKNLHLKQEHSKESENLYTVVKDAFDKLSNKRRSEFQRLWVKYTKVSRTISNLQHKENYRLKNLEAKNLDYKVIGNPRFKKKTKLKNNDILNRKVGLTMTLGDLHAETIKDNRDRQ